MQVSKGKKGSVIVEATAIFPIVIISAIVLIMMMTYFFDQLNKRVEMHIALRACSGKICENTFYDYKVPDDLVIYENGQQIYSSFSVSSNSNWMLNRREKEIASRKYLIDECNYIRLANSVRDGLITDE